MTFEGTLALVYLVIALFFFANAYFLWQIKSSEIAKGLAIVNGLFGVAVIYAIFSEIQGGRELLSFIDDLDTARRAGSLFT